MLKGGTTRWVLLFGPWAIKFPRLARLRDGLAANQEEIRWASNPGRFTELCPIYLHVLDWLVVMPRARILTHGECIALLKAEEFPDHHPEPVPYEDKCSDWGRLPDGRLVVIDYAKSVIEAQYNRPRR